MKYKAMRPHEVFVNFNQNYYLDDGRKARMNLDDNSWNYENKNNQRDKIISKE